MTSYNGNDDTDRRADRKTTLEDRIVATLENGSAELDPALRRRLDRIRAEAVDTRAGGSGGRAWFGSPWKPLAAGLATASVALALALVVFDRPAQTEPPPLTADLDVLTDPRFELFVEDPAFVAWLVEVQPEASPSENSG